MHHEYGGSGSAYETETEIGIGNGDSYGKWCSKNSSLWKDWSLAFCRSGTQYLVVNAVENRYTWNWSSCDTGDATSNCRYSSYCTATPRTEFVHLPVISDWETNPFG